MTRSYRADLARASSAVRTCLARMRPGARTRPARACSTARTRPARVSSTARTRLVRTGSAGPIPVVVLVLAAGLLAGCAGSPPSAHAGTCLNSLATAAPASPGTAASRATAVSPAPAASRATATGIGPRLGGLTLDCLDGTGAVKVALSRIPMVINLWASWCAPCRAELPQMQRYATLAAGRVAVIWVDTRDTDSAARSLVGDLHLTFPVLADPDARLASAVGRSTLPVTLFVSPGGAVMHVHDAAPLTEAGVASLATTYLGAVVPG